jgi:hypothetical protein
VFGINVADLRGWFSNPEALIEVLEEMERILTKATPEL